MQKVIAGVLLAPFAIGFMVLAGVVFAEGGLVGVLQLFGLLIMIIGIAIGFIWQEAKRDGIFKFVQRGRIYIVTSGEGSMRIIANLPPGWVVDNQRLRIVPVGTFDELLQAGVVNTFLQWLQNRYGLFWKGFPPAKIHKWKLVHQRVNPDMTEDTAPKDWIKSDTEAREEEYILFDTPHWFRVPGVEFVDGFRADVLLQTQTYVVDPIMAVITREGRFYEQLDSLCQTATNDVLCIMDYMMQYLPTNKGPSGPIAEKLKDAIAPDIPVLAGLELGRIFIYRSDASSVEEQKLTREKKAAEIRLEVAKLDARGSAADVQEIIKIIKRQLPNATHDEVLKVAGNLGYADRIARSGVVALGSNTGAMFDPTKAGGKKKR